MFAGLSAFPLTPLHEDRVDEAAYSGLIGRLVEAGVDSITALGSTGSYMYLDRAERRNVAAATVREAGDIPVMVGIGALRTSHVLALAEDAQQASADAVLLASVTYQPLTDDDVFGLFEEVTANLSVPLVVYDNPGTTHVTFTDDLYAGISRLPNVASIKIHGIPDDPGLAAARVREIRHLVPDHVTVGVSGDATAATGLNAGCDAWYSVIGGTLPDQDLALTRAAQAGNADEARQRSAELEPLWSLFAEYGGSYRVIAAIAEALGLVASESLPRPIRGLDAESRARVRAVLRQLQLDTSTR